MVSATMMLGAVFFTHGTGDVDLDIKLRWSSGQTSRKKLLLLHISYPRVIKHSSIFNMLCLTIIDVIAFHVKLFNQ